LVDRVFGEWSPHRGKRAYEEQARCGPDAEDENWRRGFRKACRTQLDRTTLDDLLAMVEADYKANSRKSADRVKYAAARLRTFFGGKSKARDITADRITAFAAQRLGESKASNGQLRDGDAAAWLPSWEKAGKVARRPEIDMLHVDNARKGFFELAQHRAVLAHLPEYLEAVAAVAYITGWRAKSETPNPSVAPRRFRKWLAQA